MSDGAYMPDRDAEYVEVLLEPIRMCHDYRPKFGRGGRAGLSLHEFKRLYQDDALYRWFGLDDPMMYSAHKAAGGMTSVYRQVGIAVERLFRRVIMDSLALAPDDVTWSYEVLGASGRKRRLHLDARVPVADIGNDDSRRRFHAWMEQAATALGVDADVFASLKGTVFEVRQGYKSKDSKRLNADDANAAAAYANGYLPCFAVLSGQVDNEVLARYSAAKWAVLTGSLGNGDPVRSTYDFLRDVLDYDLAAFFERHSVVLQQEVRSVLRNLMVST